MTDVFQNQLRLECLCTDPGENGTTTFVYMMKQSYTVYDIDFRNNEITSACKIGPAENEERAFILTLAKGKVTSVPGVQCCFPVED